MPNAGDPLISYPGLRNQAEARVLPNGNHEHGAHVVALQVQVLSNSSSK